MMNNKDNVELLIQAGQSDRNYWSDVWRYRELLFFLAWRDVIIRYKQTVIGFSWVLIRPILTMVVFTIVFGRIANLQSNNVPYSLLVFSGLLPWLFFSAALSECSNSLVGNAQLLSKIYFPRIIVPISTMLVAVVDFAISFSLIFLLMIWYKIYPDWHVLGLIYFILLTALAAFSFGIWFAALTVKYRDFKHLVPFMLLLGIYASPVGYSTTLIPEKWKFVYYLNPMASVIDGFRWSIISGELYWPGQLFTVLFCFIVLFTGIRYFRRSEGNFADDL